MKETEVSTYTWNENMTHSHIHYHIKETNKDTLYKVIEDIPDDTSPDMMEDCVNEELDDRNQNNLS